MSILKNSILTFTIVDLGLQVRIHHNGSGTVSLDPLL